MALNFSDIKNMAAKRYAESQESQESQMTSCTIESFLGELFMYRNLIHLAHLNTQSFAAHMALNDLYEGLLGHVDNLAETAQTDTLLNIIVPGCSTADANVSCATQLLECVRNKRYVFPYSFQQNICDEIESLTSSAIYKLKFLK
jgi:hypothetical protein